MGILRRRSPGLGFTLIELLVVIAIIAILAAILFPVFAQARAKARQASCTSNVKQLDLAFMMYVQDYDENFPFWNWGNSWDGAGAGGGHTPNHFESMWANAIYPYVKNAGVYACPSTNDKSTARQNLWWGWDQTDADFLNSNSVPALYNATVSYGMSEPLESGGVCNSNGFTGCSEASLNKPANTLLVADCNPGLTTGWLPDNTNPNDPLHHAIIARVAYPNAPSGCWNNQIACGVTWNNNTYPPTPNYRPDLSPLASQFDEQARHSQGDMIGFADGHVKWMRARQITWDLFNGGP